MKQDEEEIGDRKTRTYSSRAEARHAPPPDRLPRPSSPPAQTFIAAITLGSLAAAGGAIGKDTGGGGAGAGGTDVLCDTEYGEVTAI